MIALFVPSNRVPVLPGMPHLGVVEVRCPERLREVLPLCWACIVVCEDPGSDPNFYLQLAVWARLCPELYCVAPFTDAFIRALAPIAIAGIIKPEDASDELARLVRRVSERDPGAATQYLSRSATAALSPWAARAVSVLCERQDSPVLSVCSWRRRLHMTDATFRRSWRRWIGSLPPKVLVDWIVLLRSLEVARACAKSVAVAALIGVDQSTLHRLSKRLTGRSFQANQRPVGLGKTLREFRSMVAGLVGHPSDAADARARSRRSVAG